MDLERELDALIAREGGYVHDPADAGGETNWGITRRTARDFGYDGEMRAMPLATAKAVYRAQYWGKPGFARVAVLSEPVAAELFDTGVNMGTAAAVRFLQRALNAFSRNGRDYPLVAIDGVCGPASVSALAAYLKRRGRDGEQVMVRALNSLQGERYIALVEQRPANAAFLFGWFRTRVSL